MYWEVGAEWKYLNTDIANAYLNKTDILSPPFTVSVGYKHDGRFKQAGDLAGFLNPEARFFFRFSVGLNKIGNWTGDKVDPGKGYTSTNFMSRGLKPEIPINPAWLRQWNRISPWVTGVNSLQNHMYD